MPKSKDSITPLAPGKTGWPLFYRDRDMYVNGWRKRWTRIPAWMRIIANYHDDFPKVTENTMQSICHHFFRDEENRKRLPLLNPEEHNLPMHREFLEFMQANPQTMGHWTRHNGRARAGFRGTQPLQKELLNGGRIYPFELAHMRIPETLAYDDDVVWMMALCQGAIPNFANRFLPDDHPEKKADYPSVVHASTAARGLEKYLTDPHVRFAIASPYMTQFGIDLGQSFTKNLSRVEFLLRNPYSASTGELEVVLNTPQFLTGWAQATDAMSMSKGSRPVPPPSGLYFPYSNGSIRRSEVTEWCIWKKGKQRPGGY